MRRVAAALVVAATFLAQPAQAQIYRWVDDQGVIHLSSEKPPPGVKAERIEIAASSKRPATKSTTGGGAIGPATGVAKTAGATMAGSAANARGALTIPIRM